MFGLIASALAGGIEGAGVGAAQVGKEFLADDFEKQKQAAIAQREENLARINNEARASDSALDRQARVDIIPKQTAAQIEVNNAKPEIIPGGSTVRAPGKPDFTAPKVAEPKTPEELKEIASRGGYYDAKSEEAKANARLVDSGGKTKTEKPIFPKLIRGDEGGSFFIDQNTNALGTVIPATPGKPGEHNWIFPDKPEVKGKPASMSWNVGGETLTDSEYNSRFYGNANKISAQMSGAGGGAPARPAGGAPTQAAIDALRAHPEKADDFKSYYGVDPAQYLQKKPAAAAPAPAPAKTSPSVPDQTPDSAKALGAAVDKARTETAAAQQILKGYGLIKKGSDPGGFKAAQEAFAAKRRAQDEIEAAYQDALGGSAAARSKLRM